jgi:hypothetical protein
MKKMKKTITTILLAIILLGSFGFVSAQEETANVDAGFNILNWAKYATSGVLGGGFSVVGTTRQCDLYPRKQLSVDYTKPIPEASTFCTNSLVDVFDANWNPLGEYKDMGSMACMDEDGCIVQYYCCPHPECNLDSDCITWYGTGSTCLSQTATDENIIYKSGTSFKYCYSQNQAQVTCFYYPGTGTSCVSSPSTTYVGQTSCPVSYMGMTLYPSQEQCSSNIPTGGEATPTTPCYLIKKRGECKDTLGCEWDATGVLGFVLGIEGECKSIIETPTTTTTTPNVTIAETISLEELEYTSSSDAKASLCSDTRKCSGDAKCVSLENLVPSDISQSKSDSMRQSFCDELVGEIPILSNALSFVLSTYGNDYSKTCTQLPKDDRQTYFEANYGICIAKEDLEDKDTLNLEGIFGWAKIIDITGDEGIDGLITIVALFLLITFLFKPKPQAQYYMPQAFGRK